MSPVRRAKKQIDIAVSDVIVNAQTETKELKDET